MKEKSCLWQTSKSLKSSKDVTPVISPWPMPVVSRTVLHHQGPWQASAEQTIGLSQQQLPTVIPSVWNSRSCFGVEAELFLAAKRSLSGGSRVQWNMSEAVWEQGHPDPKWRPQKTTGDTVLQIWTSNQKESGPQLPKLFLTFRLEPGKQNQRSSSFSPHHPPYPGIALQCSLKATVKETNTDKPNEEMRTFCSHGRPVPHAVYRRLQILFLLLCTTIISSSYDSLTTFYRW